MTYIVHLWEHAAPDTLQDAQTLHERLGALPPPDSGKFGELARALVQRFPVQVGGSRAPDGAEGGEPGEWVESTPDGVSTSAVYSLALYGDGLQELLPFLIDTATALGLTVYDDQAGQAFLPGGWVLDGEGLSAAAPREEQAPAVELVTTTAVKAALKAFAATHFKPLGLAFKADRFGGTLVRKTPVGEQVLVIMLADIGGVRISLAAHVAPTLPPHIAEITHPQTSMPLTFGPCTALQAFAEQLFGLDPWPAFSVYTPQDLQRWLKGYAEMVRTELLPLLDACRDAAGVLHCDTPAGRRYPAHFKPSVVALALARSAGEAKDDWLRRVEEFRARQAAEHGAGVPVEVSEPRITALAALGGV